MAFSISDSAIHWVEAAITSGSAIPPVSVTASSTTGAAGDVLTALVALGLVTNDI